jgi:protein TonB
MLQFLQENIYYPSGAKDAAIEGTVYVTFTVGKDGTLSDIKVKKGLGMGLDEAAIEGVKKMPKWTPARQNGSPTRLSKTIPVKFKLSN